MSTKREQCHTKNPNPVLSVAKDCTVLYSNEAGKLLLIEWGVTVGEQLPTYIAEVLQRVLSKKSPEKIEVNVGKKVYLTSFYHFPEDECVNIYGFDISYQEGLESKLCESEEKYRNIVETANEGIWIHDAEARTTYVNKKMAEMLGYSPEELINRLILDFVSEECKNTAKLKLKNRRLGISESFELKKILATINLKVAPRK